MTRLILHANQLTVQYDSHVGQEEAAWAYLESIYTEWLTVEPADVAT